MKDINHRLTLSNELKLNYSKKLEQQININEQQNKLISNLKQQIQELEIKQKRLDQRIRDGNNQHKDTIQKLNQKYSQEQEIIDDLRNQLQNKLQNITELNMTIYNGQETIIRLQENINNLTKALHDQREEYTNERNLLQQNIMKLLNEKSYYDTNYSHLQEQYANITNTNVQLFEENKVLHNQVHNIREKIDEFRLKYEQLLQEKVEIEKLQQQEEKPIPSSTNTNNTKEVSLSPNMIPPSSTASTITLPVNEPISTTSSLQPPISLSSISTSTSAINNSSTKSPNIPLSRSVYHQHAHQNKPVTKQHSDWSRTPRFFIPFQNKSNNKNNLQNISPKTTQQSTIPGQKSNTLSNEGQSLRTLVRKNKPILSSSR